MTGDPATCARHQKLNDAAQQMWDHDVGAVPIVDERGKAVGVITDRDICMAAYTQGRVLSEIPLEAVMSQELLTVAPEADVEVVRNLMREHQVRRILAVDRTGAPVGIVSMNDVIPRAVICLSERSIARLYASAGGRSICRPTRPIAVSDK